MRLAAVLLLASAPGYFTPTHRVSGIGADRDDLSAEVVDARTGLMIEAQTFAIMREQEALAGAKRITADPKLRPLFRSAAQESGFPAELLEAIAYLESWGDAKAESPHGPKGIMQVSDATARDMGLKLVYATRYRVTRERVRIPGKGPARYKMVTHRTPYTVLLRDERLMPERAIPAAANYLAWMERLFGGRDWAIFAYHCGRGCVTEMMDLTRRAHGIPKNQLTVPRMFFSASPAYNRELYQAIGQQMQRDYSPTYYFRVRKAVELLDLYRRDPKGFAVLHEEYRSQFATGSRAPHRLSVWLKREDLVFRNAGDLGGARGERLVAAPERPEYYGYELRLPPGAPDRASAATIGTLAYVAFETRRLYEELRPRGAAYVPIPVTGLVRPEDAPPASGEREGLSHASGQVFDIDYSGLPPGELECLRFVLDDLGWNGYLGFVEEGRESMHIGCSPESREFFATVYGEAVGEK